MQPEEIFEAELVGDDSNRASESRPAKPGLIEQALSPQSLQWMMLSGGGLLVIGFVAWLWSVGLFENPIIISGVVGAATLSLLAGGVAMVRLTRYQLAGRGIALLGSVVLPLNLWLYDAQGLVTLANGGHLWIPAALFCLIYAAVARVLRDSTFVYALVGGVVMTGMLLLADQTVGHFWALMPPVTFLVVIGWLSAFADRLFVDDDGDFSRKNFGVAFHRAGLVVVTAGLMLLLGGHLVAAETYLLSGKLWPLIAVSHPQKLWALGVIASSMIGFGLQSTVRENRFYRITAALLGVWLIPATMNFFAINVTVSHVAIATATVVVLGNAFVAWLRRDGGKGVQQKASATVISAIESFSAPVAACLAVLAVGQFISQSFVLTAPIFSSLGWISTLQILTAGIAACAYAWNCQSELSESKLKDILGYLSIIMGVSLLVAAAWSATFVQTLLPLSLAAATILLIPIGLGLLSLVAKKRWSISMLQSSAMAAMTAYLMIRGCIELSDPSSLMSGVLSDTSLRWSAILATATAVYAMAAWKQRNVVARLMSYIAGMMSVAILANSVGLDFGYCLVLAPMLVGVAMRVFEALKACQGEDAATTRLGSLPLSASD